MLKFIKRTLFVGLLLLTYSTTFAIGIFYSKGSLAPNTASNWNDARNGSGTNASAADFTNGSTFVIESGDAMVTTAVWALTTGTTIQIENGGSLQANHNIDLSGDGIFQVDDGGTYIHNHSGSLAAGIFNAFDVILTTIPGTFASGGSNFDIRSNINLTIPPANNLGLGDFGNLIIGTGITVTTSPATTTTFAINGTLTISGTGIFNLQQNSIVDNGNGTGFTTSGSGILRTQKSGSPGLPSGTIWNCRVEYNRVSAQTIQAGQYTNLDATGGPRIITGSSVIEISGTFTPGAGPYTLNTSKFVFNGVSSQSIPSMTFYDLQISNTGGTVSAAGTITMNHQLIVDASAILDMGTNAIAGISTTTSGTGLIKTQNASSALPTNRAWFPTVEYNLSTGGQSIIDGTYANLVLSNSSGIQTAASNITVTSNLSVGSGGTFELGTNQLITVGGTISGTGTIRTERASAALPVGKNWTQTVEYYATAGSQSIINGTYASLNLSNSSGTQTAAGDVAVTNNLTVSAGGTFDLENYKLLTVGGIIAGTGTIKTQETSVNPIPTGKSWTQTVEYNNNGNQTIANGTYANLVLSNSSGIKTADGAITVINDLTIASGNTFNLSTFALSGLAGIISGTGTLQTDNTGSTPTPSGKTWTGTVVYNSASAQTIVAGSYVDLTASNGDRTFSSSGNINISGVFTPGTGTYTSTGSTVVFNASGSQTIPAFTGSYNNLMASGGNRVLSSTGSIVIEGTFTPGSGTYTSTSSTVVFNASGSQNVPPITGSYNNVTASNTGTKSLTGNVTVLGTLTLSSSSDFLAINGNTLELQGATSMTGALKGSSTSNLTISGSAGGSSTVRFNAAANDSLLNILTLNRTGASAGVTLGTNVAITNLLSVTAGELNINGQIITLKSTSITNTAQVDKVTGTINYGSNGSFTVERFIPNSPTNNRAYRDLSTGVNTSIGVNFFQTWQENGSASTGFGTHISGVAGASPGGVDAVSGLDLTQTGNVSMYSYVNGVFSSVTNTKLTKPNIYQAYRVLIRGDRNTNLYLTPQPTTMSSPTVLRANGEIVTGTVTYTTLGVAGNLTSAIGLNTVNTAGDFSLLGNPYVCAVDWNSLAKTNLSTTYWVYDATIGTTGAYVTWDGVTNSNGSSNVDQYIQPGQGFFIETSTLGPQLVISENDKAPNSTLTNVFRINATVNKLGLKIGKVVSGRGNVVMDGTVVVFSPTDNNEVNGQDATKFSNNTENIFIRRANKNISIEHRSTSAVTDTIPLGFSTVSNTGIYTLTVDSRNFTSANTAYILDKFLHTEKMVKLNDTTNVSFTVNTGDLTSINNRFFIVFRSSIVPLNNLSLNAYTKNSGVQIEWNTTNETQLSSYEVEKSVTGINFSKIGSVVAKNDIANSYGAFDAAPQKGTNYYRIKIIGQDNTAKYSKTVLLNLADIKADITIYPNPIRGNSLSLQLNSLQKGNYDFIIFNSAGQNVFSQSFVYNGGAGTQVIDWGNKKLAAGNYIVSINSQNGTRINKPIFIEE